MYSQVETFIRGNQPAGTLFNSNIPLVKGSDGKFYPKNLANDYVSRFAVVASLLIYLESALKNIFLR